jgi:hypothetical protein
MALKAFLWYKGQAGNVFRILSQYNQKERVCYV